MELSETEQPSTLQAPPYLDYRRATDEEQLAVEAIKNQPWLLQDQQNQADQLIAIPAVIRGVMLVVPSQLLRTTSPVDEDVTYTQHVTETKQVERWAVDLALKPEYA